MRKTATLAILVAVLALTTAVAWAVRPGGRAMAGPGQCQGAQWKEKLGLTDAQTASLQKECEAFHGRRAEGRGETVGGWKALNDLLSADKVDEAAVSAQARKIASAATDRIKAQSDHLLAVRKILTADQYRQFSAMMKEHMQGGRMRGQHFRGGDNGAGNEEESE